MSGKVRTLLKRITQEKIPQISQESDSTGWMTKATEQVMKARSKKSKNW